MKTILLHYPDSSDEQIFNPNVRDNFNDPFIFLKEKLLSFGYELKIAGNNSLENCEWVLFMDSPFSRNNWKKWLKNFITAKIKTPKKPERNLYKECLNNEMKDKMALFLWEGMSVRPDNYLKSVYDKFSYIFTWNDKYVDNVKFFKFYLPVPRKTSNNNPSKIPFIKKKLLVNISMNKRSIYQHELYSTRKKSIRYFNKNSPNDFDLYGVGWNQPRSHKEKFFPCLVEKFSTYRGKIKNKTDVLPKYKFCLCYENMKGESGYVTEKVFDCMRANTVPIYWGASNINDHIDSGAFIDRRKFKNDEDLAQYLKQMTEEDYNKYLVAGARYLQSEKYAKFLPENFANTIIKTLKLQET